MAAANTFTAVSVNAYLHDEATGRAKHEYVGGFVYAMAGGTKRHNLVATNILVSLGAQLKGKPCRPYNSDTKIRLRQAAQVRFYYPDVSVICRPNAQTDPFQDEPAVIVEVLSDSTRRTDEGEKRDAYLGIPSVTSYLLVDPDRPHVLHYRRTDHGFVPESFGTLDAIVDLHEIEAQLSLQGIYDAVVFDEGCP
jgi:Uma2 family endonuclease